MFAPQPIVMRYGPEGLALQAATHLSDLNNQHIALQLAQQGVQNSLMREQEGMNYDLGAQRLQLAGQLQQQRLAGSPTSQNYWRASGGPMAQSIKLQKQLTRSTMLGGMSLTPEQDAQFAAAESNPNVSADDYERLVRGVATTQHQQSATAAAAERLKMQADAAVQRRQLAEQRAAEKAAGQQRATIMPRLKMLADTLKQGNYDVSGPPTQFNPTQTVTPRSTLGQFSDLAVSGITGGEFGGGPSADVSLQGGDPEAMRQYIEYQQLQQQLAGAQPGASTAATNIPHITSAEDYAALPSGTHYVDPDGHLRVKP